MEGKGLSSQKMLGTVIEYHKTVMELRQELLSQSFTARFFSQKVEFLGGWKEKRKRQGPRMCGSQTSDECALPDGSEAVDMPILQWPSQESLLDWRMEPELSGSNRSGTTLSVQDPEVCNDEGKDETVSVQDPEIYNDEGKDETVQAEKLPCPDHQSLSGHVGEEESHLTMYESQFFPDGVFSQNEIDTGEALICGTDLDIVKDKEEPAQRQLEETWNNQQIKMAHNCIEQVDKYRCPTCGQATALREKEEVVEAPNSALVLYQEDWAPPHSGNSLVGTPVLSRKASRSTENLGYDSEVILSNEHDGTYTDELVTQDTCDLLCTLRDKLQDMHTELTTFVSEPLD